MPPGTNSAHPDEEISAQQVRHVAGLARLELTDEELDRYRGDLSKVLAWVSMLSEKTQDHDADELRAEELNEARMDGVEQHATTRLDDDQPSPMLDRDVLERMAPLMDGRFLAVPKVLPGGEG